MGRCDARAFVVALLIVASSGCAKVPPPVVEAEPADMAAAAQQIGADLARQIAPGSAGRAVVFDPMVDKATGQQTTATQRAETLVTAALSQSAKGLSVVPFDAESAGESRLVGTGVLATAPSAPDYSLSVSVADRQTGLVVARAIRRFRDATVDVTPTEFFSESPSSARDRTTDGYIATAATEPGQAADAVYLEQVPTAGILADATKALEADRYPEALRGFSTASARKDGQQLRTFNGLYLSHIRMGNLAGAEEAFGKIVALGLATNNLAVKFLFEPNTTTFLADPNVSGQYSMWLRQISRLAATGQTCLKVVGHSSKSGSEDANLRLSLARATFVRTQLTSAIRGRTQVEGVGFSRVIIGTGTDDARDALDRRVEFQVVPCSSR